MAGKGRGRSGSEKTNPPVSKPSSSWASQMITDSEIDEYFKKLNLYRKPISKDGSCLFRVVSEQIYQTQAKHYQVRLECIKFMRENKDMFEAFVEGPFEHHLFQLKNKEEWGGQVEISALSLLYKCDFIVYQGVNPHPCPVTCNGFNKKIYLCYSNGNHYDALYPASFKANAAMVQSQLYNLLINKVYPEIDRIEKDKTPFNGTPTEDETNKPKVAETNNNSAYWQIKRSLDPNNYRNIEVEVWEASKSKSQHADRMIAAKMQFQPGDLCEAVIKQSDIVSESLRVKIIEVQAEKCIVFSEDHKRKLLIPICDLKNVANGENAESYTNLPGYYNKFDNEDDFQQAKRKVKGRRERTDDQRQQQRDQRPPENRRQQEQRNQRARPVKREEAKRRESNTPKPLQKVDVPVESPTEQVESTTPLISPNTPSSDGEVKMAQPTESPAAFWVRMRKPGSEAPIDTKMNIENNMAPESNKPNTDKDNSAKETTAKSRPHVTKTASAEKISASKERAEKSQSQPLKQAGSKNTSQPSTATDKPATASSKKKPTSSTPVQEVKNPWKTLPSQNGPFKLESEALNNEPTTKYIAPALDSTPRESSKTTLKMSTPRETVQSKVQLETPPVMTKPVSAHEVMPPAPVKIPPPAQPTFNGPEEPQGEITPKEEAVEPQKEMINSQEEQITPREEQVTLQEPTATPPIQTTIDATRRMFNLTTQACAKLNEVRENIIASSPKMSDKTQTTDSQSRPTETNYVKSPPVMSHVKNLNFVSDETCVERKFQRMEFNNSPTMNSYGKYEQGDDTGRHNKDRHKKKVSFANDPQIFENHMNSSEPGKIKLPPDHIENHINAQQEVKHNSIPQQQQLPATYLQQQQQQHPTQGGIQYLQPVQQPIYLQTQTGIVPVAVSNDFEGKDLPEDINILRYFYNFGVQCYTMQVYNQNINTPQLLTTSPVNQQPLINQGVLSPQNNPINPVNQTGILPLPVQNNQFRATQTVLLNSDMNMLQGNEGGYAPHHANDTPPPMADMHPGAYSPNRPHHHQQPAFYGNVYEQYETRALPQQRGGMSRYNGVGRMPGVNHTQGRLYTQQRVMQPPHRGQNFHAY